MDADQIADAVVTKLKESHHTLWLDPETHSQQHEFIQTLIDERTDKLIRRKKIEDYIAGSLILGAILTLIGLIGGGALAWVKGVIK